MSKFRKVFTWVAALMMLLPLLMGAFAIRGQAEPVPAPEPPEKINITLNK